MSQLLRQLYDKHYLQRNSRVRECGGVEYIYGLHHEHEIIAYEN